MRVQNFFGQEKKNRGKIMLAIINGKDYTIRDNKFYRMILLGSKDFAMINGELYGLFNHTNVYDLYATPVTGADISIDGLMYTKLNMDNVIFEQDHIFVKDISLGFLEGTLVSFDNEWNSYANFFMSQDTT